MVNIRRSAQGADSQFHKLRVAVAGGYTAGHVLAGLAFLKTYKEEFGAEGYFIGCAGGVEQRLVPAHGERLHMIAGTAFARQGLGGRAKAVLGMLRGAMQARRLLREQGTELVIGVGGYASVGGSLAAWSLGIPLVIHESNAHPGLANRLLGRMAQRVCVGFEEAAPVFGRGGRRRVDYTGNPATMVPSVVRSSSEPWRMLVSGGSLGSAFLNRVAPPLLARVQELGYRTSVRHLAGTPMDTDSGVEAIRRSYAVLGIQARVDPFTESIGPAYAEADFVIGGAGALTLADIAAAGLPSLLVPLARAANDHQSDNARAFAAHTGAVWVKERDWNTERVAQQIAEILNQPELFASMGRRARAFARPDAAVRVVQICEQVLDRAPVPDATAGSVR